MLAATLITLTSIAGLLIIPWLKKDFIRYVVSFLIGLAVGSLLGDGILHLIPHVSNDSKVLQQLNGLQSLFKI